ncbi:T9SS type A sorting domain-containing protein [Aestuariivivens sediminicola]|uniref:T9SS type A sorting domain-containing protein n=1 Tax=Aestuariivivens sediminicola TaxID=2913560 RepID=UPI001F5815CF|nr:T9SS type A sorting domain-containing protein [Aestuariivivens sediminicola]
MTKITRLVFMVMLLFQIGYTTCAFETEANSFTLHTTSSDPVIQRVRIYFISPHGMTRYLLLGFTSDNSATDGFDFGYDALNLDDLPDDLNWMIENDRYLIQGVGAFNDTKTYPLGMFLKNSGDISIGLYRTENFDDPIHVYVHDAYLNTYTEITEETTFNEAMTKGDYTDRFYIAFKDNSEDNVAKNSLSGPEAFAENTRIQYLTNSKELYVNTGGSQHIKNITIYNLLGQRVYSANGIQNQMTKMALPNLKGNYAIVSVESPEGYIATKQIVIH